MLICSCGGFDLEIKLERWSSLDQDGGGEINWTDWATGTPIEQFIDVCVRARISFYDHWTTALDWAPSLNRVWNFLGCADFVDDRFAYFSAPESKPLRTRIFFTSSHYPWNALDNMSWIGRTPRISHYMYWVFKLNWITWPS